MNNFFVNQKKKKKQNKNTFQQSTDLKGPTDENVLAQAPGLLLTRSSTLESERERNYGRRLNWAKDLITEMRIQIGSFKIGKRYHRAKAYISIKTETDMRYMIFMRSSLTTATDETFRRIRSEGDSKLLKIATHYYENHGNELLFMGRVRYKPVRGQPLKDYHRCNLPQTLLIMYRDCDDQQVAKLFLVDNEYTFVCSTEVSDKQSQYYNYEGLYEIESRTLSMEEAFSG